MTVSRCTISLVKKPRISNTSSLALWSATTPSPHHCRNFTTRRLVKEAWRYSDHVVYSATVMLSVLASAARNFSRFVASCSSYAAESAGPGGSSPYRVLMSQGSLAEAATALLVSNASPKPPCIVSASSTSTFSTSSSSAFDDLRRAFNARNFCTLSTRAASCRNWKMRSLLEKTRLPRREAYSSAVVI